MPNSNVLIIGAGRIGQALAYLIERGSSTAQVNMWDKNDQRVPHQEPVAELVPSANIIFCCTPSWTVREVVGHIKPLLSAETLVVTLAKGCEADSGKTMAEVLDEIIPHQPRAVLGGPMLSEVLHHGQSGEGVLGSTYRTRAEDVITLFNDTPLTMMVSKDIYGVSLCGCLKNIYAFTVGIGAGLGWESHRLDQWLAIAQYELIACGQAIGISLDTLHSAAGIADFRQTSSSPTSFNRQTGFDLGHHGRLLRSCEATITLPSIMKRLPQPERFPLINALPSILSGQQPPAIFSQRLTSLAPSL